MKLTCIILNYNDATNTLKLAKAINGYNSIDDVVIVDNFSTDDSAKQLRASEGNKIHVVQTDRNGGYGYGNNFGARYAFAVLGADAVMIVNPDVKFDEKLVDKLEYALATRENVGVVSAIQLNTSGKEITRSAWRIPKKWNYIFSIGMILSRLIPSFYYSLEELHHSTLVEVECVAGSLLMISKQAFEMTGGYDEDMFLYCEETTIGCKMKSAGFISYICSDVQYYHMHGVSITKSIKSTVRQKKIMLQSHHLLLRRYLHANQFELIVDGIMGKIALFEESLKIVVRSFAKGGN